MTRSRKKLYRKNSSLFGSLAAAASGIAFSFKERNIRVQASVAVVIILLAVLFPLEALERMVVLILIASVVSLEMLNTAFEKFIDFHVKTFEPDIAKVKDIAAGAVLLYSLVALIIGLSIFIKYLV